MSRCSYPNCTMTPLNPAVPAYNTHMCTECHMGVIMRTDPAWPKVRPCAICYRANPPQSSV